MSTEQNKPTVKFSVVPNGPLHAEGKLTIITPDGKTVEIADEAWFCRCGASKNKPFCDGSHKSYGTKL